MQKKRVLSQIINRSTLEVELEESSRFPISIHELVYISSLQTDNNSRAEYISYSISSALSGTHFAFVPFNNRMFSILLINKTINSLAYSHYESYKDINLGLLE